MIPGKHSHRQNFGFPTINVREKHEISINVAIYSTFPTAKFNTLKVVEILDYAPPVDGILFGISP